MRFPPAPTLFVSQFAAQAAFLAPVPVLPAIAGDLGVSVAAAGQLRTISGAAAALAALGIEASAPCIYPEYAPDYWGTFFTDPDGLRLEVTNFREIRKKRMYRWDEL